MNDNDKPERVRQIDFFGIDNPYMMERKEEEAQTKEPAPKEVVRTVEQNSEVTKF